MPEHPHSSDDTIVNPGAHHDESEINVRALMAFVAIFVVFALLSHAALWLLFRFYVQSGRGARNPPMTQILRPADADVPALPRLQPFPTKAGGDVRSPVADTPVADLEQMRAHEDAVLNNYGWVDRQKETIRIPISQAKQLALQRGLFVLNTSTVAQPSPAPAPGGATTTKGTPP